MIRYYQKVTISTVLAPKVSHLANFTLLQAGRSILPAKGLPMKASILYSLFHSILVYF